MNMAGTPRKPLSSQIGRKTERTETDSTLQALVVGVDQLAATREAKGAGQYQRRAESVRSLFEETDAREPGSARCRRDRRSS